MAIRITNHHMSVCWLVEIVLLGWCPGHWWWSSTENDTYIPCFRTCNRRCNLWHAYCL